MKYTTAALTAAILLQGASATSWRKFEPFGCPKTIKNDCLPEWRDDFDWNDVNPGTKLDSYKGFKFGGWTCKGGKLGKRDELSKRTFNSKCISAPVTKRVPSNSIDCDKQFSIGHLDLSLDDIEDDHDEVDLELHYSMPDKSTCKKVTSCKKGGSSIPNDQCGGAKSVKIIVHERSKAKKCNVNIHKIKFECGDNTKPPACTKCNQPPAQCSNGKGPDGKCNKCRKGEKEMPNGSCKPCPNGQNRDGSCKPCPNGENRNGSCKPCPNGENRNGSCKPCPNGENRNGSCKPCPNGVNRDGSCKPCPNGTNRDGSCKPSTPECPAGETKKDGVCKPDTPTTPETPEECKDGETKDAEGVCKPTTPETPEECKDGETKDAEGVCKPTVPETPEDCKDGETKDAEGVCKPTVPETPEDCKDGETKDAEGVCKPTVPETPEECKAGETKDAEGVCKPTVPETPEECKAGETKDAEGVCKPTVPETPEECKAGEEKDESGACKPTTPENPEECKAGEEKDESGACKPTTPENPETPEECKDGEEKDEAGVCQPTTPTTPTTPEECAEGEFKNEDGECKPITSSALPEENTSSTPAPTATPCPVGEMPDKNGDCKPTTVTPPPTDCPNTLPKCLKTWLFLTNCDDTADPKCFCKNPEFIKKVVECVDSWSEKDEETTKGIEYLAGLCAPHVPENPGAVVTCVPPHITLTVPASIPVTTIVATQTVVVPCEPTTLTKPATSIVTVTETAPGITITTTIEQPESVVVVTETTSTTTFTAQVPAVTLNPEVDTPEMEYPPEVVPTAEPGFAPTTLLTAFPTGTGSLPGSFPNATGAPIIPVVTDAAGSIVARAGVAVAAFMAAAVFVL